MDTEHRTTRYKNLMARQHDAMVKPRRFNVGDLVLKGVSLATKNPAHGKLGPNWEGPYKVINCEDKDPTTWKPWTGGNWSTLGMLNT